MSDLQKFIRQQFFDNHWTRDVDPASLTVEKLHSLDASFCHIDVKSKLCLLLAFSNAKADLPHEVSPGLFLNCPLEFIMVFGE